MRTIAVGLLLLLLALPARAEEALPAGAIARLLAPTATSTARLRPTIAFSPDGRQVAVVHGPDDARALTLFETARWTRAQDVTTTGRWVAFSPDAKRLAVPRGEGVALLDAATREPTGAPVVLPRGAQGGAASGARALADGAAFSPDGKTLLVLGHYPAKAGGAADEPLVLACHETTAFTARFTIESKPTPLGIWDGHGAPAQGALFTPDGRTFATAALDRRIGLWETATGKLSRTFELDCEPPPLAPVAFSRDGMRLVLGDRKGVRLYDMRTGRPGPAMPAAAEVRAIALSPDGDTLALGLTTGAIQLASLKTLKPLRGVPGLGAGIASLAFSPDGRGLAAGSVDGGVIVWKAR